MRILPAGLFNIYMFAMLRSPELQQVYASDQVLRSIMHQNLFASQVSGYLLQWLVSVVHLSMHPIPFLMALSSTSHI